MNILFIAYYYPPINSTGSIRFQKLKKYLEMLGHNITVITCRPENAKNKNDDQIVRVPDITDIFHGSSSIRYTIRILRKIMYCLGICPSYPAGWRFFVLNKCKNIKNMKDFDAIITTYPPLETHLIGRILSKKYNIPLILDFRDGLCFEPIQKNNFFVKWRHKRIEQELVRSALSIVCVTEKITEYFRKTYQNVKCLTIPNGFDPDDFLQVDKKWISNRFNIVYTGRLMKSKGDREILPLINALYLIDPSLRDKINFIFMGDYTKNEIKLLSRFAEVKGFLPRIECLAYQKSADALLLITGTDCSGVATGKIYEYIAQKKPILGLTKGTIAEEIILKVGCGIVASPNDAHEIANALKQIIKYNIIIDDNERNKFSYTELAAEYDRHIRMQCNEKI